MLIAFCAGLYVALLAFPGLLFRYHARAGNIMVSSDRPIPPAVVSVLRNVQNRLARSPLDDPRLQHRIFICNETWRFALFANTDCGAGGVNKAWLNRNIFLRRADIARDRLIGPSGNETPGERTLAYFMAHEITHSLEVHYLGRLDYVRLPVWKREGYADYVARDAEISFPDRLAAFQNSAPEMDPTRSGLYLRYQLLVWYTLNIQHLSPQEMLTGPVSSIALERNFRAMQ